MSQSIPNLWLLKHVKTQFYCQNTILGVHIYMCIIPSYVQFISPISINIFVGWNTFFVGESSAILMYHSSINCCEAAMTSCEKRAKSCAASRWTAGEKPCLTNRHGYIFIYIYMNEYKSFSQTKNLAHIELLSRPQLGDLEEIPGVRLPWSTGPDVGDFTP